MRLNLRLLQFGQAFLKATRDISAPSPQTVSDENSGPSPMISGRKKTKTLLARQRRRGEHWFIASISPLTFFLLRQGAKTSVMAA